MSQQVAGQGSMWGWGGGGGESQLTGTWARERGLGVGRGAGWKGSGWGVPKGGGQVGRGGWGGGGAAAIRTQTAERAASANPGARTAPRRGRDFRQDHQLEQAAQGGPGDHLGALATAPRRGPTVRCRGIASWRGRASHSP